MFYFSKSKYCSLRQCPKMLWLKKYKPEAWVEDPQAQAIMETGNRVGDLAMGLFGDFVEVTAFGSDGRLDLRRMLEATREEMAAGTPVICEASFSYEGLYCAVDLLRKTPGGWAIYEVKSSTRAKPIYYADIAYQKYVLEHCGLTVTGTYLVHLNSSYVRGPELDLQQLFTVVDVAAELPAEEALLEDNLSLAQQLLACGDEPEQDIGPQCRSPYTCGFWDYCTRALPHPNVFGLRGVHFSTALKHFRAGLADYESLLDSGLLKGLSQMQADFALHDRGLYADKPALRDFLAQLSYPLYFLDFETMMPAVPLYEGTRPFAQIPFQYSLHYIEAEGGPLLHREFLAQSGPDPRRAVAEHLCADIPQNVCVTAYNKSFECSRLAELAEAFPDLADHLLNIREHIVDLMIPFQKGWCYNRAMGGSASIKSVLPALFPDDPALDYHNLEGVHNGGEAMDLFPRLARLPQAQREQLRCDLLKYCGLDTFAMVKVWQALTEAAR